jgi:hypothetical protein
VYFAFDNADGVLIFEDIDNYAKHMEGADKLLGTGVYAPANVKDEPMPEFVLVITRVYSLARYYKEILECADVSALWKAVTCRRTRQMSSLLCVRIWLPVLS